MTAHAKLSASGSSIWINCLGSTHLNAGKKGTTSPYAAEGQLAHKVAESFLTDAVPPPYEDEMLEAVKVYVDFCKSVTPDDAEFTGVEVTVKLDGLWHPNDKPKDPLFGQCDYICRHGHVLNVVDYKHGKGVPVEVEGNTQIMYYGLGALLMFDDHTITQVNMTIVQPRAPHDDGPVRTETMTALDLLMWGKKTLKPLVDKIESAGNGELKLTDGAWCRFCPSLGDCPQVHKTAMLVAQTDFEPTSPKPPIPQTLDNDQLSNILGASEQIRSWLTAVQGEASHRIDQGQKIKDWKLVDKRSNRTWKDADKMQETLRQKSYQLYDYMAPGKLKSPTQLLAYFKKHNHDMSVLDGQIIKPITGTTLVSASDKRPEVSSGPALDFDVISED